MYYKKLENLIKQIPEDRNAIERFDELYNKVSRGSKTPVYDINRLFDLVRPSSLASLSNLLIKLEDNGFLEKIIYVESSKGGAAAEFQAFNEIPETIHDIRADEDVRVTPDNIKVSYKILPN